HGEGDEGRDEGGDQEAGEPGGALHGVASLTPGGCWMRGDEGGRESAGDREGKKRRLLLGE
ncbi:MAG: hypothetical protein L6R43_03515, partial [Planctomycetes bacterium]|nr:hypothetical protein [Planctomycetota bacterium]